MQATTTTTTTTSCAAANRGEECPFWERPIVDASELVNFLKKKYHVGDMAKYFAHNCDDALGGAMPEEIKIGIFGYTSKKREQREREREQREREQRDHLCVFMCFKCLV